MLNKIYEEFYDYGTAPVNGDDVVDTHKTGMPFYDQFISHNPANIAYLRDRENLKGDVVMMSPEEYYKLCSQYGFPNRHPSVDKLKRERRMDKKILDHLVDVLTVYKKKFPMPMLNKAESGQEGLHRMMVIGDMFGWDHKVPVLVVDWADKQRAFEEQKQARIDRISRSIERAVRKALMFFYNDEDELKDQLQSELDKEFEYNDDDIEVPVKFDFEVKNNEYVVSIGAAKASFDLDEVEFRDAQENTSDYLDLDDLEASEDFLRRYFGDDWRETHPHLKDTFNIKD